MVRKIAVLSFLLASLAIFSSRPAFAQFIPSAIITPDGFTYPDTRAGTQSTVEIFTVTKSPSTLPLYIISVAVLDTTDFILASDGCTGQVLGDQDSCQIGVIFSPSQAALFKTVLVVKNLGKGLADYAILVGRGVAPAVTLSQTSVDFGDQTVGSSGTPRDVTLTNNGTSALTITGVTAQGEFSETNDCDGTVDVGASCTLSITFLPLTVGAKAGTVSITDDAADSPQLITLAGNGVTPGGPDVSLSTTALQFGSELIGNSSNPMQIIMKNDGAAILNITSIAASGDFSQTNSCGASLTAGSSCIIQAVFTPTQVGARSGTITITDDASDSPQTVSLAGIGDQQTSPSVSLSVSSIDFGQQPIGTLSAPRTITLTNAGTSDLSDLSSEIVGEGNHSFSEVDHCQGLTVPPGGTCSIDVVFDPSLDNSVFAALSITNNAPNSPQTVSLTGFGFEPLNSSSCSLGGAGGSPAQAAVILMMALGGLYSVRRRR